MVCPHLKVFWLSKDKFAGQSERIANRKKKRWENNIQERTGMDFTNSVRAAEGRIRWKGIVKNSPVVRAQTTSEDYRMN